MTDRLAATYVYRLDIAYPEGSRYNPERPLDRGWMRWEPEGWVHPDNDSTDPDVDLSFRWPVERQFLSKTAAMRRVKRLESYGAKAVVVRSQEVTF